MFPHLKKKRKYLCNRSMQHEHKKKSPTDNYTQLVVLHRKPCLPSPPNPKLLIQKQKPNKPGRYQYQYHHQVQVQFQVRRRKAPKSILRSSLIFPISPNSLGCSVSLFRTNLHLTSPSNWVQDYYTYTRNRNGCSYLPCP